MKTSGCLLQCLKSSCFAHGPLCACESLHTYSGSCVCRLHEQLGWLGSVLVHLCEWPDFQKAFPEAPWCAAQVAATVDDLVDAVACACGPELAAAEAGPAPAAAGGGDPSRGAGDATCSSLQALGRQRGSEDAGASADGEPDAGALAEAGGAAGSGWGANARAAAQNGGGGHPPGGSGRSVGEAAAAGDGSGGGGGRPVAAPARSAAAQGPAASGTCARAGLGSAFLDLDGRGGDPARRWVLPSDEDEFAVGGGGAPSAGAAAHPGSAGQTGGGVPGRPVPAGAAGPAPSAAEGAAGGDGPARGGPAEPAARPGADVPPPWQPVAATPAMELRRRREREADSSGKRGAPGGGGSVKVEPGVGHGRGGGGGGGRGHGAAQRPSAAPDVKPALGAFSARCVVRVPPGVALRAQSAPVEPAVHRALAPTWLSSVLLSASQGQRRQGAPHVARPPGRARRARRPGGGAAPAQDQRARGRRRGRAGLRARPRRARAGRCAARARRRGCRLPRARGVAGGCGLVRGGRARVQRRIRATQPVVPLRRAGARPTGRAPPAGAGRCVPGSGRSRGSRPPARAGLLTGAQGGAPGARRGSGAHPRAPAVRCSPGVQDIPARRSVAWRGGTRR